MIDSIPNNKNAFLVQSFTSCKGNTSKIKTLNIRILGGKDIQLFSISAQSELLIQEKKIKSKKHLKKLIEPVVEQKESQVPAYCYWRNCVLQAGEKRETLIKVLEKWATKTLHFFCLMIL